MTQAIIRSASFLPIPSARRQISGHSPIPAVLMAAIFMTGLAGCARSDEGFPSLAIRDAERVQGTMQPPPPYVPPPTPAAVADQLTELARQGESAHREFDNIAARARRAVNAARGNGPGTDSWAVAQIAVAELESQRSATMITMADLDRLYVDAAVEAGELTRIEETRAKVEALVARENALIDELLANLR